MYQSVSCGLFGGNDRKFQKKLDFWGQIWLNNSVETYNRTLVSGCKREFITGFYHWGGM